MGILSLDCIAADPYSKFLYGIGSAGSAEQLSQDNPYIESTAFLVRSNASPTNLSTISWTVVSSVRGNDYSYNYQTFTSVDCATNGRGDFTAFFRSPFRTVSPAKLLPMGLRYSPDSDSWTAIQGTSLHGWTSDECLHKSFYTHPESLDVFHLLTNMEVYQTTFGRLDVTNNLFIPESSPDWDIKNVVRANVEVGMNPHSVYDYTKRGFFSSTAMYYSRFITYHRDTFYFSSVGSGSNKCPSIPTSLSTTGRLGKSCTFRSPSPPEEGGALNQYYTFGGDRNGTTFFGGIYDIDKALKIYTTENVTDRAYLEYPITRTDISSDLVVDRNFQVVGGLAPGQEPFVVALTSRGLFEFTIFGPGAGKMSGPYQVETNDQIFSAIQRVVKTRKDRAPSAISNGENTKKTVIGGSLAAVLVVLVIGGLFWWRRRTQRKGRIMKDKEEGEDVGSDSEDPGPAFVGKHELHSMGLFPESESESSSSEHRTSQETSIDQPSTTATPTTATRGRPRTNGRLPSYTYQDHIRELDFSSHPRPNVVTLVGDREQ